MDNEVTVNISCTMSEKHMNNFLTLLRRMAYDGAIGHTEKITIDIDGDGDFQPKFKFSDRNLDWDFQGGKYLYSFPEDSEVFYL